jgi:AraC-like DNA-binding protein
VHDWQTHYDPKTRGLHHRVTPGFGHSLLAPLVARVFRVLRISAAVHEHDDNWVLLHAEPNLQEFEIEHGVDQGRYAYNERSLSLAHQRKRTIRGEYHGYFDLFAPIVARRKVVATLVTGPFATRAPNGAEILARWYRLTGRKGHLADPEFAAYLGASLSILVLEGKKATLFKQLIDCVVELMAGEGRADRLTNRVEALRAELEPARFAERTWESVRDLLDERFQRVSQHGRVNDLRDLGLTREADHLLVGLGVSSSPDPDPVDEVIRRNAFQRTAVDLARSIGDAIAGQIGDQGVVFFSSESGSTSKKRRKVVEISERASALARRRFGLTLHFGGCAIDGTVPLRFAYQAALGAAESALASGETLLMVDPTTKRSPASLRQLRQDLAKVEERSSVLRARFDGYLEAVAMHCRYRVDIARGHLEAGFERMAEPLVARGTLDERSFRALCESLDRAAEGARTMSDLLAAYRRAALDLSGALQQPVQARRDRNLRGALAYIHRHYRERLSRERVARVAGFAPAYFSVLFSEREKTTFERYLLRLRIEQAKQLLEDTRLPAARVAELAGFKSPQYFCTAFRQATNMAPIEYRLDPKKAVGRRAEGGSAGAPTRVKRT